MLTSREKLIRRTEHTLRCNSKGIICGICKAVFCSTCDRRGASTDSEENTKTPWFGVCGRCLPKLIIKPPPPATRSDLWSSATTDHKKRCAPGVENRKRGFCSGCGIYGCKACCGSWNRFFVLSARTEDFPSPTNSRAIDFCGTCFQRIFNIGGPDVQEEAGAGME